MRKACVVIVILLLALGGYACGRSNDESGVESKVEGEVKSLEKDVSGEVKKERMIMGLWKQKRIMRKLLKKNPRRHQRYWEKEQEGMS